MGVIESFEMVFFLVEEYCSFLNSCKLFNNILGKEEGECSLEEGIEKFGVSVF